MSNPKKIKMLKTLKLVRKLKEDLKKGEMAAEQKKLQAYKDQTNYLADLRNQTYNTIQESMSETVNTSELIKYQVYLRQLHIRSILSKESEKEQAQFVEEKRIELLKANQKKTVAEKILEKQEKIYEDSIQKLENKEMDDFSSIFFQRELNKKKDD